MEICGNEGGQSLLHDLKAMPPSTGAAKHIFSCPAWRPTSAALTSHGERELASRKCEFDFRRAVFRQFTNSMPSASHMFTIE